jgi:hypothetical protein
MGLLQAMLRPAFKRLTAKYADPRNVELAGLLASHGAWLVDHPYWIMPEKPIWDFIGQQKDWTTLKEVKKNVDDALGIVNAAQLLKPLTCRGIAR